MVFCFLSYLMNTMPHASQNTEAITLPADFCDISLFCFYGTSPTKSSVFINKRCKKTHKWFHSDVFILSTCSRIVMTFLQNK